VVLRHNKNKNCASTETVGHQRAIKRHKTSVTFLTVTVNSAWHWVQWSISSLDTQELDLRRRRSNDNRSAFFHRRLLSLSTSTVYTVTSNSRHYYYFYWLLLHLLQVLLLLLPLLLSPISSAVTFTATKLWTSCKWDANAKSSCIMWQRVQ